MIDEKKDRQILVLAEEIISCTFAKFGQCPFHTRSGEEGKRMTEHPIIRPAHSVRAILNGIQTVMRLVPPDRYLKWKKGDLVKVKETYYAWGKYVKIGEVWCFSWEKDLVIFPDQITPSRPHTNVARTETGWHKRPSIFMPVRHSRITLELTEDVYKEPLQNIKNSELECELEGCFTANGAHDIDCPYMGSYPTGEYCPAGCGSQWYWETFARIWDSINAPRGFPWVSNPDVAVIRFRRVR